jgi:hypothetical protein
MLSNGFGGLIGGRQVPDELAGMQQVLYCAVFVLPFPRLPSGIFFSWAFLVVFVARCQNIV